MDLGITNYGCKDFAGEVHEIIHSVGHYIRYEIVYTITSG